MKHFRDSLILILCLIIIGPKTSAQTLLSSSAVKFALTGQKSEERAKHVMHDNEYTTTGDEQGTFYDNPLRLDGLPLDYGEFGLFSTGQLTVIKGAAVTGETTVVPFYVYLRRNGVKILIPGKEKPDLKQMHINLSEILDYAEPGDQLVIEPVRKEDGPAKRILNLLGC